MTGWVQSLSSHFIQRNNMLPDHASDEGLAELEEFKVPFSIIFFLFVFLTLPHAIHFNSIFILMEK